MSKKSYEPIKGDSLLWWPIIRNIGQYETTPTLINHLLTNKKNKAILMSLFRKRLLSEWEALLVL